jgi:FG-GAP-like repeat/Right handed beta helix region
MRKGLVIATAVAASVLVAVVAGMYGAPRVYAIPPEPPEPPEVPCLAGLAVKSLGATPSSVNLGESSTLRWNVQVPRDCAQLRLQLNGQPVGKQGALRVTPIADTTYVLSARWLGRLQGRIATAAVRVILPAEVSIDRNDLAPLLRQALRTPDTTIRVQTGVELDLSNLGAYESMPVARGVSLIGTRTPRDPGPRLYTRNRPKRLFVIRENDVRITGLRIEGPDLDVAGGDLRATAIYISPDDDVRLDRIEIDNNELYGWNGSAIGVNDDAGRISYATNPSAVRIHDNFIHHNQHPNSAGYGVVIGDGAYALIEQNVFDYNRHAIAGDGSDGSGYRAYRNLVLQHGGRHKRVFWGHTHQFDMHGQDNCGLGDIFSDSLYNCGTAGHDVEIIRNSFLYTAGAAIKIRGTPQRKPWGAFVISNVFAHADLRYAVEQTEGGVYKRDNRVGINGSERFGSCDFDGDGSDDLFLATGETWWYASRGTGPWTYLNTSQKLLSDLRLGDFNGDGRCDVAAGGLISSGGTAPWRLL